MAGTDPYGLWLERPDDTGGLVRNAVPGRAPVASMLQPMYDACSDLWDWVWGAQPAAVRLRGGLGAIASILEIAGGFVMVKAGVAATPIGGVGLLGIGAGSVAVLHGADGLWASLKQLWTGEQQQTYTRQLLTDFFGEEKAAIVDTIIGAVGIVRGVMQIPKWGKGIRDGIERLRKGKGAERGAVTFPANDGQRGHIFRDALGHVADTAENRRLLIEVASNPANRIGVDRFGNTWSTMILPDGSQAWVSVRNGVIQNGGINLTPRDFPHLFGRQQ
jgi:hypothetical protein